MNIQLALQMDQLVQSGVNIFLKSSIVPNGLKLVFSSKNYELEIKVDDDNLLEVVSLIKSVILSDRKLSVIGWKLKDLFSYVFLKTTCDLDFEARLFDLNLAECFVGVREQCPTSFIEALERVKRVIADSSWSQFLKTYQKIYLPLLTRVLPHIEAEGVCDVKKRQILYPFYEIEGQTGGRLCCQLVHDNSFNPHSLSDEQKSVLRPKDVESTFLCFDYSFHEVCILAWLSKDERLSGLVFEEGDFYKKLFTLITGKECDTDSKRALCKDCLFLPVIYGQSAKTLAERANLDVEVAKKLMLKLKDLFPQLFSWLEGYPSQDGVYTDYIGRKRKLAAEEVYIYRNFIIQSPGAIFCLDKLVCLDKELHGYGSLVAHIHDGFVVRAKDKQVEMVKSLCLRVLEGESELYPGLKLRSNCKISKTLA